MYRYYIFPYYLLIYFIVLALLLYLMLHEEVSKTIRSDPSTLQGYEAYINDLWVSEESKKVLIQDRISTSCRLKK